MPANPCPQNYSTAVRALRQTRTDAPTRTVTLTSAVHKRDHSDREYPVTGPTSPGSLLTIQVTSGIPSLRVLSGNVRVELSSHWGNVLTVDPDARATTDLHIPYSGTKVTAEGVDPARITGNTDRLRLR
jgi:hypothetical protein